jgi:hypothetical protein
MSQIPKIEFFPVGSTTDQIRQRIDTLYPNLLERLMYCCDIANGLCYKAQLYDQRKIICIIKG